MMSSHQSLSPFRFLDLPAEIRNNIYDLMLCSWEDQLEVDPSIASKVSRRCLTHPASGFLRANKQINREASDYMIRRNQFVRVTFRGIPIEKLFLSDDIPVITTNARKVRNFSGYIMTLNVSKPVFSRDPSAFTEHEMMVLHSDLSELCDKLDFESVMADTNTTTDRHTSVSINTILTFNPSRPSTPAFQEHLLKPIAQLRGIRTLRIQGDVDSTIASDVQQLVAQPRWTDPNATLAEIHTGVDVGKRKWQQGSFYAASESWNYALRTLERMRHSSSWLPLKASGGENFVNKTADLYFTLHLLSAAFLQVDMADAHPADSLSVRRNGQASLAHLKKCSTASAMFARHADATWQPSNEQTGKMLFRNARCYRLCNSTAHAELAVSFIDTAGLLASNDRAIREESVAVHKWARHVAEMQRVAEEREVAARTRISPWGYMVAGVVELAT